MENMKEFFARDALSAHLGIELLDVSSGRSVASMTIRDFHRNVFSMVHGGAIFALADCAFQAACNSHGTVAVALNVNITYTKAAREGTLTATAEETSLGKKTGAYQITVTDEAGDTVAIFQGLAYRKRDPIEWPAAN